MEKVKVTLETIRSLDNIKEDFIETASSIEILSNEVAKHKELLEDDDIKKSNCRLQKILNMNLDV